MTGLDSFPLDKNALDDMKCNKNDETDLYQCVLYLAPSDYHRFHSPIDMTITKRNHIIGFLAPVKISYVQTHKVFYLKKNVLENNERVSIFSKWKHGFMSLIFVGALNVGSIVLNFDKDLKTNQAIGLQTKKMKILDLKNLKNSKDVNEKELDKTFAYEEDGIKAKKGDEIGRFNLGSTIVMVFELPKNGKILVNPGDKIKFGTPIATV